MTAFRRGISKDCRIGICLKRIYTRKRRLLIFIAALAVSLGTSQWSPLPQLLSSQSTAVAAEQSKTGDAPQALGARLYGEKCAGCHGTKGKGIPKLFPPLAGDPVVTAKNAHYVIRAVLFGMQGSIIGGLTYEVRMPPWAGQLSDEEVAAVINHIRSNWGNDAPAVSPAEVAKVRSEGPP
ncbi:MAG: cytochrome c [Candidatus Sulfobium sp.]|jgi:cytochrome c oxidase cbb3-type subunit 2